MRTEEHATDSMKIQPEVRHKLWEYKIRHRHRTLSEAINSALDKAGSHDGSDVKVTGD